MVAFATVTELTICYQILWNPSLHWMLPASLAAVAVLMNTSIGVVGFRATMERDPKPWYVTEGEEAGRPNPVLHRTRD